MNGISDDLRATRALVLRGQGSASYANDMIARGERWMAGLGARRTAIHFAEEVAEVEEALEELRAAARQAFGGRDRIRLLYVGPRKSKTQAALSRVKTLANLALLNDARVKGVDPGPLLEPEPILLPSVEVVRGEQGWVDRRGRARVEVAYDLVIGGNRVLMGSRRYVMRQADWALMVDAHGRLPERETLTGLAKRRALYKARKAKRRARSLGRLLRHWPATLTNYVTGERKTIYLGADEG